MDKIKLMYDVVKAMRGKDVFKGTLKAEGTKDQAKIFGFENDFERNNVTGETKAKTSTQMDCQGKKMKMENSIDFEMQGCHGPHGFFGHMHPHPHMRQCHEGHFGGIKQRVNGILFVLGVLNSVKVEEQKDKTTVLSLKWTDIPVPMKSILIIEDDINIAELEQDYLKLNGYKAEIVHDGALGLRKAVSGGYDVIIVDLMLPNKSGYEIIKEVRKKLEIPIIVVSAKSEDIDKIRGLDYGADDYMIKPFSPAELCSKDQISHQQV